MNASRQPHEFPDVPGVFFANLEGVIIEEDPELGTGTGYLYVKELEKEIATALCLRHSPLTGQEFRFVRSTMSLSRRALGKIVDREEQAIKIWEDKKDTAVETTFSRALKQEFLAHIDKLNWAIETISHSENIVFDSTILMKFHPMSGRWTSNIKVEFLARFASSQQISGPHHGFVSVTVYNKPLERVRIYNTTSNVPSAQQPIVRGVFLNSLQHEANTQHTENMTHSLTHLLVKEYVDNKGNGAHRQ